jgi:hypothetical protein
MAAVPIRYLAFLITSIITILCTIYYSTFPWSYFTFQFNFFILIATLPYTVYMLFYEFKSNKRDNLQAGLVTENNKNFMIDVYCRFLFPFLFAIFLFTIILALQTNFDLPSNGSFLLYLAQFYLGFILPVLAIFDLYYTPRRRNPTPTLDIVIISIICFGHCGYRLIASLLTDNNLKLLLPIASQYMILGLVSINGYIFYDYLSHRKAGGKGYYILFESDLNAQQESLIAGNKQNENA